MAGSVGGSGVESGAAPSDADLIRVVATGPRDDSASREAESELCRRFAPRVRLYGLRHLRDEDRARDLVQSVLVAVLEAARAGRIAEPELAVRFVLGTCRNVTARMRETEARTHPCDDRALDHLDGEAARAYAALVAEIEHLDAEALYPCIARLDHRARTVLRLSFNEEKTCADIAGRLETSEGNVRVLRHRALAALRRCLDQTARAERP